MATQQTRVTWLTYIWRRTRFGRAAKRRRTQGGHMADKVWRRGQSGIKADTRRTTADTIADNAAQSWTRGGKGLDTRRTGGGSMAEEWRTSSGARPWNISQPASFFYERTPQNTVWGKTQTAMEQQPIGT